MNIRDQINIFIVDDNKIFTLALKADIENAFMDMPVEVQTFETGEKCMEIFKEEKPQVVIIDYHLNSKYPDAADGIAILDWIKKENHETNVIMLTVDDGMDIALKSFHHGAFDYVVKTETQFRKINFSLLNLFKTMETKSYARRYKYLVIGIFICVALLVGGIIAVQIINHYS